MRRLILFAIIACSLDCLSFANGILFIVKTESELRNAIRSAGPGDVIRVWNVPIPISSTLETMRDGTAANPITIQGMGAASEISFTIEQPNNGTNCSSMLPPAGRALLDMDDVNFDLRDFDLMGNGSWNESWSNCSWSNHSRPDVDLLFRIQHSYWSVQDLRFVIRLGFISYEHRHKELVRIEPTALHTLLRRNTFQFLIFNAFSINGIGISLHGGHTTIDRCNFIDNTEGVYNPYNFMPYEGDFNQVTNCRFMLTGDNYGTRGILMYSRHNVIQGNYFGVSNPEADDDPSKSGYGWMWTGRWNEWVQTTASNVTVRNNWGVRVGNSGGFSVTQDYNNPPTNLKYDFGGNTCDLRSHYASCLYVWPGAVPSRQNIIVRPNNVLISGMTLVNYF